MTKLEEKIRVKRLKSCVASHASEEECDSIHMPKLVVVMW